MKRSSFLFPHSKATSFTLVELLVVMGIIAILAAAAMAGANAAIKRAYRAKAQAQADNIRTAVSSYYTEYSVYPAPSTASGQDWWIADTTASGTAQTDWQNLIYALAGNINPYTGAAATSTIGNTRGISFISLNKGDLDSSGIPKNPAPASTGNPGYNISIDNDYDGILTNMPSFTGSSATFTNRIMSGVGVWANCNNSGSTNNYPQFYIRTF